MRRALSIAINEYGGQYQLGACLEDSRLWTALFRDMGFEVTTLHDRQATRASVTVAIETLLRSARPGDVLALHYSGHGTRFPDLDGDEEEDGKDDALVPIDGLSDNGYLIDDDIRLLFDGLNPQVDFTFFADCCHSGTISRFTVGSKEVPRRARHASSEPTPEMVATYTRARGGCGRRGPWPTAARRR